MDEAQNPIDNRPFLHQRTNGNVNRSSDEIEEDLDTHSTIHTGPVVRLEADEMSTELKQYSSDFPKLLFAILWFIASASCNIAAVVYVHNLAEWRPLPDLVFTYVPEQRWAYPAGDALLGFCIIFGLLISFTLQHRWVVLKRVFFISGLCYFLRAICQFTTQLPVAFTNPGDYCKHQWNWTDSWAVEALGEYGTQFIKFGMTSGSSSGSLCGDMMYSGHTMVYMTIQMTISQYTPKSCWPLHWFITITCYAGIICLIISRNHYTVDVVIGYYMVVGVFALYHAVCDIPHRDRRKSQMRNITLIYRLICWLEENVSSGPLPRRFESCALLRILRPLGTFWINRRLANGDRNTHSPGGTAGDEEPNNNDDTASNNILYKQKELLDSSKLV